MDNPHISLKSDGELFVKFVRLLFNSEMEKEAIDLLLVWDFSNVSVKRLIEVLPPKQKLSQPLLQALCRGIASLEQRIRRVGHFVHLNDLIT